MTTAEVTTLPEGALLFDRQHRDQYTNYPVVRNEEVLVLLAFGRRTLLPRPVWHAWHKLSLSPIFWGDVIRIA